MYIATKGRNWLYIDWKSKWIVQNQYMEENDCTYDNSLNVYSNKRKKLIVCTNGRNWVHIRSFSN
jgi:hypothetical protein